MSQEFNITLTNGMQAKVDVEDLEKIKDYKWRALWSKRARCYYAVAGRSTYMHRLVLDAPKGMLVDHIGRSEPTELRGLDNRKSNLRLATASQNAANSIRRSTSRSPYKGICWIVPNAKWKARIRINYRNISLGCFKTARDAAMAYDSAAIKYFGEFACLNFPR